MVEAQQNTPEKMDLEAKGEQSETELSGGRPATAKLEESKPTSRRNSSRFWVVAGLVSACLIVVAGALVGISILYLSQDNDNEKDAVVELVAGEDPTAATPSSGVPTEEEPTLSRNEQVNILMEYLVSQRISTRIDLNTPDSPQQRALNFMAVEDGTGRVPPRNKDTPDGYDFVTRYVLSVLYYSTIGDRWVYNLNFMQPTIPTCGWYSVLEIMQHSNNSNHELRGVACNEDDQITALFMTQNNMHGELPKELGRLTTLKTVDFSFNLLRGTIPQGYQTLVNMQNITMMSNQLNGTLPSWINNLSSLKALNLADNLITGKIPQEIGSLQQLEFLALDNNILTGQVDRAFDTSVVQGLRKLNELHLDGNYITGTIGDTFALEANLTHLTMPDNFLTGTVPSHLLGMKELKVLVLKTNGFTAIPLQFQTNTKLELLALQRNGFKQLIPPTIHRLEALEHLDLSQNKFSGQIPSSIGAMNLTYLFLADNVFDEGPIPKWISNFNYLSELDLKSTQRTGSIPSFLGEMESLELLDLDNNELGGTIPSSMGELSRLMILLLNRNNLTGEIPSTFSNLSSLKVFFVEANGGISGDLNSLYCTNPSLPMNPVIVADCHTCSLAAPDCCQTCCEESNMECNTGTHVPDLDPIWQLDYHSTFFTFGREDFFDKHQHGSLEDILDRHPPTHSPTKPPTPPPILSVTSSSKRAEHGFP